MDYHDIGVAIVGSGFMGPAHTEALRRLGISVRGILGSSEEKSTRAAAQLGIPRAYATYDELLADERIHSVHITTPNKHHHSMVVAALDAGKHVLCEKPLAMNAAESRDLVNRAKASQVEAGVNYNIRFYPLCIEAANSCIGNVHSVQGSYVQDWLLFDTDYNWRVLASEGGDLRAVADIGTHWLDLVGYVTGLRVESVFADLKTIHLVRNRPVGEVETFSKSTNAELVETPITTEDQGAVLLRFAGGATGVLWVSQATAGRKNRLQFEIGGAEGSLAWDSENPNELWRGKRTQANEVLPKDPGLLSPAAAHHTSYPGGHAEGYPDSFKQCFRAFYDAVRGEPGPVAYPSFEDGHREILLCEAILESHRHGRWTRVEEN